MTKTRRIIAGLTLATTPVLMVGCTGAEVQDFFAGQGRPISAEQADRIAKVVTYLEDKADRHADRCGTSTTTTTTEAPTTTAAVKASYKRHGCGEGSDHGSGFKGGKSKSRHYR